ncbi:MAG: hypothetical protein ACLSHC_17615 [Bilophila wadsworthia]
MSAARTRTDQIGGTTNFADLGEFPGDERQSESGRFGPAWCSTAAEALPFDPQIEEHVRHSWYAGDAVHIALAGVTVSKFTFMGGGSLFVFRLRLRRERRNWNAQVRWPILSNAGSSWWSTARCRPSA